MDGTDLLRAIQSTIRAYTQTASPGSVPRQLRVYDDHSALLFVLPIPAGDCVPPPVAVTTPPVCGWQFTVNRAAFDGRVLAITGRKLDVLKALAETPGGATLTVAELRKAAWADADIEETTIRWYVNDLRKAVKEAFPDFDGDPLPGSGAGYSLLIR